MVANMGQPNAQQQQLLHPVKGSSEQQQALANADRWAALLAEALRNDSRAAADCSPEHKAAVLHNSTSGTASPPVLDWGCELDQCDSKFVSSLVDAHRRRNTTLLGLTQCDLFRRIVGRTLWIMGDSQMQRFYTTLNCFMKPFYERAEEPRRRVDFVTTLAEFEKIKKRVLDAPRSRAETDCGEYCGHTAGVGDLWCTWLLSRTRICHIRVNRAQQLILDFLPNLSLFNVTRDDILVTNFGLWHHKREANFGALAQQLADYYSSHRKELPATFIWRDSTPQHFDIEHGEFPHPDEAGHLLAWPFKCVPIQGVELLPDGRLTGNNSHVVAGGWRNRESEGPIRRSGMLYMQTWNETVPMFDGHTFTPQVECSHFCHPGAYNIWVWQLTELLERFQSRGFSDGGSSRGSAKSRGSVERRPKSSMEQRRHH